jgi:hypothetical protein
MAMEGMGRPEMKVLPDEALVPDRNRIVPPPNQFTHTVARRQPYYWDQPDRPAGHFAAGTPVTLLVHDGGPLCRVVDERGLYVVTEHPGLTPR